MIDTLPRTPSPLPPPRMGLYGRAEMLDTIDRYLDDSRDHSRVLVIQGDGGTGKTRLLEEIMRKLNDAQRPYLPIYDFYHIDNFRGSAIEMNIAHALERQPGTEDADFARYWQACQRLEQVRIAGAQIGQAQQAVRQAFRDCYNAVAAREQQQQRPIVLLFDTIEQAIGLYDVAEHRLHGDHPDASYSGDRWLLEMLPHLHNTLVSLAGRKYTLYGERIVLYERLSERMPVETILLGGMDYPAMCQFVRDIQAWFIDHAADEDVREMARMLDLTDEALLTTWYLISEGLPFWISTLFTFSLLGHVRGDMDQLIDQVEQTPQQIDLSPDQREHYRQAVIQVVLDDIDATAPPLLIGLQCMASLPKGVTAEILQEVVPDHVHETGFDAVEVFAQLQQLLIVKRRVLPGYAHWTNDQPEMLLFLHDEMYHWFDRHQRSKDETSAHTEIVAWYSRQIEAAEKARLSAAERLLLLRAEDADYLTTVTLRDRAMQQQQQLQLDRLSYLFLLNFDEAIAETNLLMYAAIFGREIDFDATLRQETLRSIYRLHGNVPFAVEVQHAAHWLLRVAHDESLSSNDPSAFLDYYYGQEADKPGPHFILLYLAAAVFQAFRRNVERKHEHILGLLKQAEDKSDALVVVTPGENDTRSDVWYHFVLGEVYNFNGYVHRRLYNLFEAIEWYRDSYTHKNRRARVLPAFRGTVLNNLAYALSEQGETREARKLAMEGLSIRQRHGTEHDVAVSRNTMARIEIRDSNPGRALRHARQAVVTMRTLKSVRGQSHSLPVLAEAMRKEAELLEDDPGEQDAMFAMALELLEEAETLLRDNEIGNPERWREVYQNRGCAYRSWGQIRRRRIGKVTEPIAALFEQAYKWLEEALRVSEKTQPPLILMDLHEDLAVVHVNLDEYDQRIEYHLTRSEALAPEEYQVKPGLGLQELAEPNRGYWRELAQVQLQRMLSSFGKYEFGFYEYLGEGRRERREEPGQEQFLREAAEHMVLMLAYLLQYAYYSSMLERAEQLVLRDLTRGLTPTALELLETETYKIAMKYRLERTEVLTVAQKLLQHAKNNSELRLQ